VQVPLLGALEEAEEWPDLKVQPPQPEHESNPMQSDSDRTHEQNNN